MYVPRTFAENRTDVLVDFIARYGFATVVTNASNGPAASHVPVLYERGDSEHGDLFLHLARPNPQVEDLRKSDLEVLAMFQGPHAYISPTWYATHPSVPTWNYSAVHVYGMPEVLHDIEQVKRVVVDLSERYESTSKTPWRFSALPDDYAQRMLYGIVVFRVRITRFEAKFKMSQNRDARDRAGVIAGLRAEGSADALATAKIMNNLDAGDSPLDSFG